MEHQFASRTSEEKNYNQTDGTDLLNNNDGLSFSPLLYNSNPLETLKKRNQYKKKETPMLRLLPINCHQIF